MWNTTFAIFARKLHSKTWQLTTSTIRKFQAKRLEPENLRINIKTQNSGPQV